MLDFQDEIHNYIGAVWHGLSSAYKIYMRNPIGLNTHICVNMVPVL